MQKIGHRDYGGAIDFEEMRHRAHELHDHIHKIRVTIGRENHQLLDDYLCGLLEIISDMSDTFNTAERGNHADTEYRELSSRILGDEKSAKQHTLYPIIKARMDAHSEQTYDSVQIEVLYTELFTRFAEYSTYGFLKECDESYGELADKFGMSAAREALVRVSDEDEIALLDTLAYSFFYSVSPGRIYLQAMLDQLVLSLLTKDRLSGEYAFQCLLNHEG